MTTTTKPIAEMSDAELNAEMKRRQQAKENDREAYKELVNESVPPIIKALKNLSGLIQEVKLQSFEGVTSLLDLKVKAYGIKDDQKSHTFTTSDGDSLTLGYRVRDGWDDTVGPGIAKVNQYLETLAKDEDSAWLVKMISKLLKKDAKGNLKSSRVIELDQLAKERNNEIFTDGVEIIMKAYKPVQTCFFIEATQKDAQGKDEGIPLSISSVDFPEETEFQYFKKPKL